jgi:asparaginyl-tRNA synthetase
VTTVCRSIAHLFAPGIGEIIGGSQREERLDVLDKRMDERGIDKEHYGW